MPVEGKKKEAALKKPSAGPLPRSSGLGHRIEDVARRIVREINKGSRSAGRVLHLKGLGALDQFPLFREGSYLAFHSANSQAGWQRLPSLLNTNDNEKSFANVSEVAGNSRIKMQGVCKTR
jgi:hypothetical protein